MVGLLVGLAALVCSATDGGVLFSDTFSRTSTDSAALGVQWKTQGLWYSQNEAISDLDGADIAVENVATCGDGQVSASVMGFGVPHTAIFMRSTLTGSTRYQLDLIANAHAQIQRVSGGTITVLADVASGLSDLGMPATLSLSVTGTSPVQLVAFVNGRQVASVADSSSAAITSSGYAGLYTLNAGVVFDTFVLSGASASVVVPDAGSVDAGSVVDAGSIVDAGPRDAGAIVDAGSVVDGGSESSMQDREMQALSSTQVQSSMPVLRAMRARRTLAAPAASSSPMRSRARAPTAPRSAHSGLCKASGIRKTRPSAISTGPTSLSRTSPPAATGRSPLRCSASAWRTRPSSCGRR